VDGFRAAWGPAEKDRPDARYMANYALGEQMAAHRFADGHVLMIMGILVALVAYLTRGKSEEALMKAVRDSERLGPKMADWLAKNKEQLLKDKRLLPKVRERVAQEEEAPQLSKKPRVASQPKVSETPGSKPEVEDVAPKRPTFGIGNSDGGPGVWSQSSKYPTSPADAAYQQAATGAPTGVEYKVDTPLMKSGVKYFDGYDPNTGNLIDAKNYLDWPDTKLPFSMTSVTNDMIQSDAIAGEAGTTVEFRVASQEKADLLNSIAQQNNLTSTVVTYWKP
jgi:hypothetical protein